MFSNLLHILDSNFFNLLLVMVVIWSVGIFLEKLKIPLVIGQLIAGIIIGPAVLNWIKFTPGIQTLAQLGMFFLMFYAGLQTDPKPMKKILASSLLIGVMGTIFPFALGFFAVYQIEGNFLQALFIGMAISGTSLVTKTRILDEFGILKSKIGHSMVGAAIVDNIVSFILLAVVIKTCRLGTINLWDGIFTSVEVMTFFAVTLFIGYVIFPRVGKMFADRSWLGFTFALIVGLFFAVLAEAIYLPFILGAYLAGLFVREEIMSSDAFHEMNDRLMIITNGFLGPIFIMSVSFKVSFDIIFEHPVLVCLVVVAAFIGKFLGVFLGSKFSRFSTGEALAMGVGMNGRGAVELVFAATGVELGILTNSHLSMLVFVAFATTLMTPFLLKRILRRNDILM